ncbi:kelch-like protein 6 [Dreissena polymorpha]|uniref:kelch-like protein 6 n=1 Tax=Dreissena polymorpha TaxID=45954 RepID=UPI0022645D34|nr:kelch-like protein 6 [Dreissena polymorpha]XP_052255785.1 kelch-like protein 6 [Dreissena polymorpha]XP_052255786.1 kelch-like protein 6 [Dreissena polymorpha]XP_052255787.1 kelch-like protein 6 [Dreissena polymorpha]XP_052255788.1 kelch-like protein 6 [Dreissena polymorpha]XP_052255789.1 kelch-like protein 6 [Dreissena polymorpha]
MASKALEGQDKSRDLSVAIHKGLTELWLDEVCTDFEIVTDTKTFRCHKVVLAAMSDYFRAMFSSGMTEAIENRATFQDISADAFEILFEILYPRKKNMNIFENKSEEDVTALLNMSMRFQMKFLQEICTEYFAATMSVTNCVERWKTGQLILCDSVTKMAWDFILDEFGDLVEEPVLLTLEFEDLNKILNDPNLYVKEETIIWKAIKKWISVEEDSRKKHFFTLFKNCCLSEIDQDFFLENIAFDPLVRGSDDVSCLVKEAVLLTKHPGNHGNVELTFRNCYTKHQTLIALCKSNDDFDQVGKIRPFGKKQSSTDVATLDVYSLDFTSRNLKRTGSLDGVGSRPACCVHGDALYIVGGTDGTLMKLKGPSMGTVNLEDMPTPLEGHTMAAVDGCLFVLGGKHAFQANSSVFAYFLDTNQWREEGEILAPVVGASSIAVNGVIYIVGGKLGHNPADCIQSYDTRDKACSIFYSLPSPCEFSRTLCRGVFLYIVSSSGEVFKISTTAGTCETVAMIANFNRKNFGIDLRDGKLYIFGGLGVVAIQEPKVKHQELELDSGDEEDEEEGHEIEMSLPESFKEDSQLVSFENRMVHEVLVVDTKTGEITGSEPLQTAMQVMGCGLLVHDIVK